MKIKQLAVTYSDKVILVIVVAVFLSAGYRAFFTGDPEKQQLEEEIPQDLTRLERNLETSEPPPLPEFEDADILARRYSQIAVVQPYRRYVLYRPTPIELGTFGFIEGRDGKIEVKGVQLVRVVYHNSEHIEVPEPPQLIDADDPSAGSYISIDPVESTSRKKTRLLARDIEGVQYLAHVIVYTEPPTVRPNPPRDVTAEVFRDKVLLSMRWDNPETPTRSIAEAVGFWVYRKLEGRPDSSFRLLNEDQPAAPSDQHRRAVEQELGIGQYAVEREDAMGYYDDGDILIPEEVTPAPRRPRRPDRAEEGLEDDEFADLAYYVDRTVEPGETYVYKVVAVTSMVDQQRRESEPWISDPPVHVPSDVRFILTNIITRGASFRVWKRDHELGVWHNATFLVAPGMPVGKSRRARYRDPYTDEFRTKEVDFSTGARLVAAFTDAKIFEPEHSYTREETRTGMPRILPKWDLKETQGNLAVILTKKQELVHIYRGRPPADIEEERQRTRTERRRGAGEMDPMDEPVWEP